MGTIEISKLMSMDFKMIPFNQNSDNLGECILNTIWDAFAQQKLRFFSRKPQPRYYENCINILLPDYAFHLLVKYVEQNIALTDQLTICYMTIKNGNYFFRDHPILLGYENAIVVYHTGAISMGNSNLIIKAPLPQIKRESFEVFEHEYKGFGIHPSRCKVEIRERTNETFITFIEMDIGTSVTNASEQLADEIAPKANSKNIRFFERYIRTEIEKDQGFKDGYAEVTYQVVNGKYRSADWKHLTKEEYVHIVS